MIVIVMSRTSLSISQYNSVSNIAYNSTAETFTITYGATSQTVTFPIAQNTLHIMTS